MLLVLLNLFMYFGLKKGQHIDSFPKKIIFWRYMKEIGLDYSNLYIFIHNNIIFYAAISRYFPSSIHPDHKTTKKKFLDRVAMSGK